MKNIFHSQMQEYFSFITRQKFKVINIRAEHVLSSYNLVTDNIDRKVCIVRNISCHKLSMLYFKDQIEPDFFK